MRTTNISKHFVRTLLLAGTAAAFFGPLAPAQADDKLVPLSGLVTAPPETVVFQGNAKVNSRLAPDPDFGNPQLVLTIDVSGLSGSGSATREPYQVFGPEIIQRRLAATQTVEITFPFKAANADQFTTFTGIASFALDFDMATGDITRARGNVSSPNF
jgi:hypothetical protein